MDHLAYYNAGCEPGRGRFRPKVWLRRLFRKIMLPGSQRLVAILASLVGRLDVAEHQVRDLQAQLDELRRRHDDLAVKLPAAVAFGWDYVALVRRLAALEEHVDALLSARADAASSVATPAEPAPRARAG